MNCLGIPISDDTVFQQSQRNISALGTQEPHSLVTVAGTRPQLWGHPGIFGTPRDC